MTAFVLRDRAHGVSAAMNITPLVDVMLVLLVIFMLAVPMTTQRLPLLNPPPCHGSCPRPAEPVRLAIKRSGELYWNGAAINTPRLAEKLLSLAHDEHAGALELHPQANTRFALVAEVLAAARNAEVRQVAIVQQTK